MSRRRNGVDTDHRFAIVPEALAFSAASDGAVRLYTVLARHADDEGLSYPARSRLAKLCGCSVDSVDRRIRELVDGGWLVVEPRKDDGGQRSNHYRVLRVPSRTSAAPSSRKDAAPPSRVGAAQNESHSEREPTEREGGFALGRGQLAEIKRARAS